MTERDDSLQPEVARRARQHVSDEQKIQWAIERFTGSGMDVRQLARKYVRNEAVISRAIASAFEEGLVEVRKVPRGQGRRLGKLEADLRRRFTSLQTAFVLDVNEPEADELHEYLGYALSDHLLDGVMRDGDRVVVGAGRSIFHMADRLRQLERPLKADGVRIISACGDSYPFHDDPSRNVCLDADANANALAQAFHHRANVELTSRHLFDGDKVRRDSYYQPLWEAPPAIGLLGLGVVNQSHQLYLLTDEKRQADFPRTQIPVDVGEVVRGVLAAIEDEQFDVAEIGMHFFVIPKSGDRAEVNSEKEQFVARLNRLLFAPTREQMAAIHYLLIVGGGRMKAPALSYLLETGLAHPDDDRRVAVRALFTDRVCAEVLLSRA